MATPVAFSAGITPAIMAAPRAAMTEKRAAAGIHAELEPEGSPLEPHVLTEPGQTELRRDHAEERTRAGQH